MDSLSHPIFWVKERVLGKGSYGVVYLAVPTVDDLPYLAIKTARLEDSSTLEKERRIIESLSGSPEIVRCLGAKIDVEIEIGFVYNLILEYASGGTLVDLIRSRGGRLPELEVQSYTRSLLKGLCCIHENGYVHCDLKPANILVFAGQEGINQVKIADFGLAKEPGDSRKFGDYYKLRFRGTPTYMSPESVAFGEIETALDIWSLGCIVVEMFTGRPAMRWTNDAKTFVRELIFMKQRPMIPEDMSNKGKDFLLKCFSENPRERWTAKMLLEHPFIVDEVTATTTSLPAETTFSFLSLPSMNCPELGFVS